MSNTKADRFARAQEFVDYAEKITVPSETSYEVIWDD